MSKFFPTSTLRKFAMGFTAAVTLTSLLPVDPVSASTFKLTVTKTGSGSGTVTSSPGLISCGSTCTATLDSGTLISLIATPSVGHTFAGWSGACFGTGGCIVSMTSAKTVTATFNAVPKTLTVSKGGVGAGSVTSKPTGINCGTSCSSGSKSFAVGTSVTLTATASSGNLFTGWSGDGCSGTSTTCTVVMTGDREITATFQRRPVLRIIKSGSGTVASNVGGISCGRTCSATYAIGASVTLTATAASGSVFEGWNGGGCAGSARTCTVTMDASRDIGAAFARSFTLTVKRAGSGTGKVTSDVDEIDCGLKCSANMIQDEVVVLTAEPDPGHVFSGWSGACTGTGDECTVTMSAARAVTATFTQVPYQLEVIKDGNGSGTVFSNLIGIDCGTRCKSSVPSGVSLTLTPTPAAGSAFVGWWDEEDNPVEGCDEVGPCTVKMIGDTTIVAVFEPGYALNVAKSGSGSGTVVSEPAGIDCGPPCSGSFVLGEVVVLSAEAADDSTFGGWSEVSCGDSETCTVTMTSPKTVTASFSKIPFELTVATDGGTGSGSVTSNIAGIDCPDASCSAEFDSGSLVRLTALADSGFMFTGWNGACTGTRLTCSVRMSDARSVTAAFEPSYELSVGKLGFGSGSVSWNPGGADCGEGCTRTYLNETAVTLTATPNAGSIFGGWTGDCSDFSGPVCTLIIDAQKSVFAWFDLSHQLTVSKTGGGSVVSLDGINCGVACQANFGDGFFIELTAQPAPGNAFAGWSGACSGTASVCSLVMDGPKAVTARFAPMVTLSVSTVGSTGSGKVTSAAPLIDCIGTCSLPIARGSVVTLTAEPAPGSRLKEWSGRCVGAGLTCVVTMSLSRSVTAIFEPVP